MLLPSSPRRRLAVALLAVPLSLLTVTACTASSGSSAGSEVGSAAVAPDAAGAISQPAPAVGSADGSAVGSANGSKPAASTLSTVPDQKLVRTATLQVTVADVTRGAAQVRSVTAGAGGVVRSEQVGTGLGGPVPAAADSDVTGPSSGSSGSSSGVTADQPAPGNASTSLAQLTIAVPADRLESVLDQLSRLGTVEQRTSSTQDVTQKHVDTQSRITTMKASIDRLRALMAQATTVDQLVRLETELSQREADLESMQAQLASLDQQVALSTVTVTLYPQTTTAPPTDGGFVAGLQAGWSAFTATLGGVVTFLGLVLPFVGLVLLIGLPVAVWWRRRSGAGRRTPPAAMPQTASETEKVPVPVGAPAAVSSEPSAERPEAGGTGPTE